VLARARARSLRAVDHRPDAGIGLGASFCIGPSRSASGILLHKVLQFLPRPARRLAWFPMQRNGPSTLSGPFRDHTGLKGPEAPSFAPNKHWEFLSI